MIIAPKLLRLFLAGFCAVLGIASAAPSPGIDGLEMKPNGMFTLDGVKAFVGHFDPAWHRSDQQPVTPARGFPQADDKTWETRFSLSPRGAKPIQIAERLDRLDASSFRLNYSAEHPEGVPTRELFLQLELPHAIALGETIEFDGNARSLPVEFAGPRLFSADQLKPRRLVLPGASGTLTVEGEFSVLAQDQREWKQDCYSFRLRFSPREEKLTRASLEVTFRFTPHESTPLPIRNAANFGFSDDAAEDRKGGWTDQGPDNDLRVLPPGPLTAAGVNFEILDEKSNGGRGAIVLGRSSQSFLPRSATVAFPSGSAARGLNHLYLLHAAAWLPPKGGVVGRVILRHTDRTETRHDIVSARDVGNWWRPLPLENGAVGWVGENPSSAVGLYVSRVPLGDKPVAELRFESAGPAMWMIAGLSASEHKIVPFTPKQPWTAAAGGEWVAHEHEIHIEKGSAFDFSAALDGPAGKHGRLVATPAGRFEFENRPGVRARFWGVNLCFGANFPDAETADHLAEQLARSGYNSVRLHHYDRHLQLKGGATWELDPDMLARFDYLFAAMKRRGLYINLDLYTSRTFSPAEFAALGFDPATDTSAASGQMHWRFKALMPVSEKAFELWSRAAASLLTHRNPHTGLTWAEDPALIGICPVNEDSPSASIESDLVVNRAYREAFAKWKEDPSSHLLAAAPGETEQKAFNRFVYEAHIRHDMRMRRFLESIGVRTPITGANHRSGQALAYVRERYDYVDAHKYHDHPSFPEQRFQLPFHFRQESSVAAAASTPRQIMPLRILGKPFAVTEFNFVRPNQFRAEGGVLMPAYAALQDWDALYNFEYSGNAQNTVRPAARGTFSIVTDPVNMLADRIAAAVFLRGDIAPARTEIGFAVQPDTAFTTRERGFPETFSRLGLVARIGSRPAAPVDVLEKHQPAAVVVDADSQAPAHKRVYAADADLAQKLQRDGVLPAGSVDAGGKRYKSDTGQIELRTDAGTVVVATPRSELFVTAPQSTLAGRQTVVRKSSVHATVAVVAVDDRPLSQSERILVTHLTDALPTNMRFATPDRRLQETTGELPHLIRRGSAELVLKLADADYQAWALSPAGARLREVPLVRQADGTWLLRLNNVSEKAVTQLAYEVARK